MNASTRILWLSDLHFEHQDKVLGHDPIARLSAVIDFINQHYTDAALCLITGDMVETATAANYTAVKSLLDTLKVPWYPMTGNHDNRAMFFNHLPLPDTAMPGFAQYTIDVPNLRLICLDSLKPGSASGVLCPDRLNWLQATLEAQPDRPSAVFLHHPPIPLGLPVLDPDGLENGPDLLDLLSDFPAVKQFFFGHVHRPVTGQINGLPYTSIRSVLYQAPPPAPAWDWDSFRPATEAPDLGVIDVTANRINVQFISFCSASFGVDPSTA
ncbi:phosphodiesterase [Roseovarius sp. EL26]|uniref:phosphodiesterase n=1 Tax=Roseovarius sp. EL26 TaxID=2126672 RepID=UPI000EA0FDAE|nr:phosphodiesterase [Roseovarius sp. EL26]